MKFSVVMPTYNRERYIGAAIESIINQTTNDWELLVIDDASDDNTEHIVKSFDDCRIKYIRLPENRGVAYARNVGYKLSEGIFIAIADSDDINHPERLEELGKYLDSNLEIDIVVSDVQIIDEHDNKGLIMEFRKTNEQLRAWWLFQPKLPSFMMFRKKQLLLQDKLYHNEAYLAAVDYQWYSNLDSASKIATVPKVLYYYRRHQNQLSTGGYQVQQNYADLVRYSLLRNIGIEPTDTEKELHSCISQSKFKTLDLPEFKACLKWLEKIYEYNISRSYVNPELLKRVFLEQLISVIESQGMFQESLYAEMQKSLLSTELHTLIPTINRNVIRNLASGNKKIYIYGSKFTAYYIGKQILDLSYNIAGFLDGNSSNWHKRLLDRPIKTSDEVGNWENSIIIITVLSNVKYEISTKLAESYKVNSKYILFASDITSSDNE